MLLGDFLFGSGGQLPTLADVSELKPTAALMVRMFGDLKLVNGDWPVLGGSHEWRREDWPMPVFARREPIGGRAWRVEYPDDNPNAVPRETSISAEEASRYPEDALLGAGVVETLLTRAAGSGKP